MNQSKQITDGALLMAIYIVLLIMSVFIPLFILIGLFILPIPFVIYASKYSWKPTLLIIILALILSLMFATLISLPLTILAGLGGLTIGTALYNKETSYQTWAKGTLGFIIGMLIVFLAAQFILGINIETELNTLIDESFEMTEKIMEQAGNTEQIEEQMTLIKEQMQSMTLFIPASIVISSIFTSLITTFLAFKIMNRIGKEKYYFTPFKKFNLPMSIFWLYFLVIILSFFNQDTTTFGIIILNSMMILTTLMVLQGYSFIFFYADFKSWPKAIPIIIIIISILIPLILMLVIRLLGIIDLGFGLKKRIGSQAK